MTQLLRRLPAPQQKQEDLQVADPSVGSFQLARKGDEVTTVVSLNTRGPPPYGKRQGWIPRNLGDYGDGGAFPEIHVAQYPLDMGKTGQMQQKVVPLQVDENGRVAWDAVLKQGAAKDKLQVWTRPEDSREKWSKAEDLEKPCLEIDMLNTERTQKALELALNGKIQAGLPTKEKEKEPEFVRYTPNPSAPGYTPNCKERVIRITEKPQDPLMPPKFKHKKVPRGPPSPPPPVHHSPARKLTAKDQKDWKVPPCISNWKNIKGYTIPLDKRLAADGRNLQDVAVNDKFAALSEDLYLAERKAREEIKIRNDMVRQKKVRDEEVREQQLRDLAMQARSQRAELASKGAGEGENQKEADARASRMEVLKQRQREIERDQRLELAGKKNVKGRDEDRDISERIALGQVSQPTSQEAQYDARLFNQTAGMDSGYHGGADEKCDLYDKPLFADRSEAGIYKYDKDRMSQHEGKLGHIGSMPGQGGKAFTGGAAEPGGDDDDEPKGGVSRTAPVEFECEDDINAREAAQRATGSRKRSRSRRARGSKDDDDAFGLDGLLEETKKR